MITNHEGKPEVTLAVSRGLDDEVESPERDFGPIWTPGNISRPALPGPVWPTSEGPGHALLSRALDPPPPWTESDEELLRHFRATGRSADFTELVRRYARPLHAYLARYLGDADLAEDVLQNTFLRVLDRCRQYRDDRPVRPWLYAIANHQAIDALRHRGRHVQISLDAPPPGSLLMSAGNGLSHARSGHVDARPRALGRRLGGAPRAVRLAGQKRGVAAEVGVGEAGHVHLPRLLIDMLPDRVPDPSVVLLEKEDSRWLHASLDRLPESLRMPVALAYQSGRSYREIAEALDLPLTTVKSRLHEAIVRLRRMALADHVIQPDPLIHL